MLFILLVIVAFFFICRKCYGKKKIGIPLVILTCIIGGIVTIAISILVSSIFKNPVQEIYTDQRRFEIVSYTTGSEECYVYYKKAEKNGYRLVKLSFSKNITVYEHKKLEHPFIVQYTKSWMPIEHGILIPWIFLAPSFDGDSRRFTEIHVQSGPNPFPNSN